MTGCKLLNGKPPEGSEFQCKAMLKRKGGRQCQKWALKGKNYCEFHGGRNGTSRVRTEHLPRFYSKALGGTLQQVVQEALDCSPADQLNLFEELALMRASASQVVAMWGAASELTNTELKITSGTLMRDVLKDVMQLCEAAARIDNAAKDKFSIHTLQHVINQIVRIAYEVFGEEHMDLVEEFDKLIQAKIKAPVENEGTLITPDTDVTEMDDSIPTE